MVLPELQSAMTGDEPLMFARQYPDVSVAVSESRSLGIPLLLQHRPEVQVVLLDDAFQHRSITPHLNILLTEFDRPFYNDWLIPTGFLREWRGGYRRADIIVVTKCPLALTVEGRDLMLKRLKPLPHQRVFFSAYRYHHPYSMFTRGARIALSSRHSVLLVCGIARTEYLVEYISGIVGHLDLLQFDDHHVYQAQDLDVISSRFQNLPGERDIQIILTTEKDAMRLEPFGATITARNLPVFLLPLEVVFLFEGGEGFDQYIRQFLLNFKV
jgi:tetraacyldisaccharide 4'-kinase